MPLYALPCSKGEKLSISFNEGGKKEEACLKVTSTNKKSTGTISHIDKKFLKFELDITNLQSETRKSQRTKNDTKSASFHPSNI